MAALNELKSRIESVKSTQKITRAMYLISASKSKKAQAQLESSLGHFRHIFITLSEILQATRAFNTPYLRIRPAGGGKLYLVITGDKGMAGGYHHNIINLLDERLEKQNSTLWVAGAMGRAHIAHQGYNVDLDFRYPVMNPSVYRAREIAEMIIEKYLAGEYNEVHVVYTTLISPLKQEPMMAQLLPLKPEDFLEPQEELERVSRMKYEPSSQEVFDHLVPYYIKGVLYGALVEAFTSEQHARMFAMDNASQKADEMITRLSLSYNRARQAQITQEIGEITGSYPN